MARAFEVGVSGGQLEAARRLLKERSEAEKPTVWFGVETHGLLPVRIYATNQEGRYGSEYKTFLLDRDGKVVHTR